MLDIRNWRTSAVLLMTLASINVTEARCAESASRRAGSSGDVRLFQQRLDAHTSLIWQGQELRRALATLEQRHHLPTWLDRRIDPNYEFDLTLNDVTLREAVQSAAEKCGANGTSFGTLWYVGPQQSVSELNTLSALARESLEGLPSQQKLSWLSSSETRWEKPTEPLALLEQLAQLNKTAIVGTELVSHDLWGPKRLPPLAAIDQATLFLVGFDLTCRFDEKTKALQIVPIERPVVVTRRHAADKRTMQSLSAADKSVQWSHAGNEVVVAGTVEFHDAIARPSGRVLAGKPAAKKASNKTPLKKRPKKQLVFTLAINNQPVGAVMEQLAKQLELKLDWAKETAPQRNQLVSCKVEEASLEELLAAVLRPAKLEARKTGDEYRITISPE